MYPDHFENFPKNFHFPKTADGYISWIFKLWSALFLLTKIHFSIDEYEIAKKYASILAYNFPESDWYRKSYNILNNLEDVANDKKWFQRYNPMKIFKKEVDDTSNNKLIKSID